MKRIAWALIVIAAAVSCTEKPKPGGKCENGRRTCQDPKTSLFCVNGSYQTDTCKGPRGCYQDKDNGACDVTNNVDGDPCPPALEGFTTCRADRKSRLMCKSGKYVVENCKGAEGCTTEQAGVATCDRGPPDLGETCTLENRQACSVDSKSFLLCKDGKYVLGQKCPGKYGCKDSGGGLVSCDPNGPFVEGDLCFFIQGACTADGKSLMECGEKKTFVVKRECPGPDRCSGVTCDSGFAEVGDMCLPGKRACSNDKKSLLKCQEKRKKVDDTEEVEVKLVVDKPCKTSCTPKDGNLECL